MKFLDLLKLALLKKLHIPASDKTPALLSRHPGQHTNPAKRAWRDLKARVGARQARRQTRKSYALKGAAHA